jgi:Domain of unknown function (DUF4276)
VARRIACVVEGHGDIEAVPIVVRRIAEQILPPVIVQVTAPLRTPKSKLVKPGELERAVELAARRVAGGGGVLVVLDSDDDCPAQIGPALLARAAGVRNGLPVAVVVAKSEFESWFVAAAESIAGSVGLPVGLQAPVDPESIRGAKEWLTQWMIGTRSYSPTLDQPTLARQFDLVMARRADSFDKFHRETARLLAQLPDVW